MKKEYKRIKIILTLLIISVFSGCSSDSNSDSDTGSSSGEIEIFSATINGTNLTNGLNNVPLNGRIEVTFSRLLNAQAISGAVSLSDSNGEANYQVNLSGGGSNAVITYSNLNAESNYTFNIDAGTLGENGARLENDFTRSFTSAEETQESKTPCTSASQNCLEKIELSGGADFSFYSSFDVISDADYTWEAIEEVIIVVHGQNRNADDYFNYMTSSLGAIDRLGNTLIIAPYFKEEAEADAGELFWDSDWREGRNSENSGVEISSFTVIDEIVSYLADAEKFPNLQELIFTGHSSGAAMIQHYAFSNKSENNFSDYSFEYIIANNQYFYYPDGQRYNESTNEFYTPDDCTGYDYWPYGFEFAPDYLEGTSQEDLTSQQVLRNTVYLLGTNDTATEGSLNTTDCAAVLLGSNRLERGRNMFNYFETFYPSENNHRKVEVEGIGHDASGMFNSNEFKDLIQN